MAIEITPDKPAIPGPSIFGVGRRMNAYEPPAVADVAFKRRLLLVVQEVSSRVQENDGLITSQIGVSEKRGVFRGVNAEIVLLAELANSGEAVRYGVVAEAGGFREDERCGLRLR